MTEEDRIDEFERMESQREKEEDVRDDWKGGKLIYQKRGITFESTTVSDKYLCMTCKEIVHRHDVDEHADNHYAIPKKQLRDGVEIYTIENGLYACAFCSRQSRTIAEAEAHWYAIHSDKWEKEMKKLKPTEQHTPTFERWAGIGRLHCETIYKQRGAEYGDSYKDVLLIFQRLLAKFLMGQITMGADELNKVNALGQVASLCDIKINRMRTGKIKLDSLDDLINYLLALRGGIKEVTGE